MRILGLAARAPARIVAQGRVPTARVAGEAEPPARPKIRTAQSCLSRGAAGARLGVRPNTRTTRAALTVGPMARSHTRATREPRPGELG
eukprot:2297406-Alexandrium_andersonii.AAC.1